MSTQALVKADPAKSPADIFFNRPLKLHDWDSFRSLVEDGTYTKADALRWLKDMEPLKQEDPRNHAHWVNQQILRLCLLHEAGLPLTGHATCERCGTKKVDPLYGRDSGYRKLCLECEERRRLSFDGGSRGNCQFIRPAYNPITRSWGLLYYWSYNGDTLLFFLADYYATREAAEAALQPIKYYQDWLAVKYNGLMSSYVNFSAIVDIEEIMKLRLPLTPEGFLDVLRSSIEAHMAQEHSMLHYQVTTALREHYRNERD